MPVKTDARPRRIKKLAVKGNVKTRAAGLPDEDALWVAANDRGSFTPGSLIALQGTAGNRAVSRLIQTKCRRTDVKDRTQIEGPAIQRSGGAGATGRPDQSHDDAVVADVAQETSTERELVCSADSGGDRSASEGARLVVCSSDAAVHRTAAATPASYQNEGTTRAGVIHPRNAGAIAVQRRNAQQAGLLTSYAPGANTNLYNIPAAVNLPQGILYSRALLPPVPAASGTEGVLDAYIVEARNIGRSLFGREFLDKNAEPAQLPSMNNWLAGRQQYLTSLEQWTSSPAGQFWYMTRHMADQFRQDLVRRTRSNSRNNQNIGLIDPFVAEVIIQQVGQAQPWIIQTNFSTSALGYITEIQVGTNTLRGHLAADPDEFKKVKLDTPPIGGYTYSPAHDVQDVSSVGHQIGSIAPGATNVANQPGLDAVTKLGAEGARFQPVRELSTSLTIDSRFYATSPNGQTQYLNFRELYQKWGDWFNRAYGISAAAVRACVLLNGHVFYGAAHRAKDYDLDNQAPAAGLAPRYTAAIALRLNQIDALFQAKLNYARGKGPEQRRAVTKFNAKTYQQIYQLRCDLRTYKRLYPDLYQAARMPPPAVAVVPVAAPAAVRAGSGYRSVMIAGSLVAVMAAPYVYRYLYGQNGLLYGW